MRTYRSDRPIRLPEMKFYQNTFLKPVRSRLPRIVK